MEMEMMFSEQKWNILKCLSENRYSPLQLANMLNTSISNISQQLRLLEASNLINKKKIQNRDKGKPRTLFSLSDNYAYLISATENFADKKLLSLTDYHKSILRIWFLENHKLHYDIEKFYWKIEPFIDNISLFGINLSEDKVEIVLTSDKQEEIKKRVKSVVERFGDSELKKMNIKVLGEKESNRLISQKKSPFFSLNDFIAIYDYNNVLLNNGKKEVATKV